MKKWMSILDFVWRAFLVIVALAGGFNAIPDFLKPISDLPSWVWWYLVLPIAILLIMFLFFPQIKSWFRKIVCRDERIRIAILLPLNHNDDFVREDAELQLQGFGRALSEIRGDIQNFDLKFIDHQSKPEIAKQIITQELKVGTKYFICTMSSVCIEISEEFSELERKYGNNKGVLVCTVSGAENIKTSKNSVYRFYINLKDEIEFLLDKIETNKKKAGIIYFNASPYTEFCANLFQSKWNNNRNGVDKIIEEHKIELKLQKKNQIKSKLTTYRNSLSDREVIFIVAYGNAYNEILEALKSINKDALIVMTSTFSFKAWEAHIMNTLNNFEWLSCKPALKQGEDFRNDVDVVTYFSMHTLEKLVQVILASNNNIDKFDEEWNNNKTPNKLQFSPIAGKTGDFKIELTKKSK